MDTLNSLSAFLGSSDLRLMVISACTAKKACGALDPQAQLTEADLDQPDRRKEGEERLQGYRLSATEMYIGAGHKFVKRAVRDLREHGYLVSHFILSAGYGLVAETELIVPYNVTFRKKSKAWIKERGRKLELRSQLLAAAQGHDRLILILGREYLESLGLPLPTTSLPRTLAYLAPSFVKRIGSGIEHRAVGEFERQALSAYSSSAKEKQFQYDVQQWRCR